MGPCGASINEVGYNMGAVYCDAILEGGATGGFENGCELGED